MGVPHCLENFLQPAQIVAVGDFRFVPEGLNLGDLGGNRFELVLRNVQVPVETDSAKAATRFKEENGATTGNEPHVTTDDAKIKEVVDAAFTCLRHRGFVNYFGLQRFGTTAIRTSDIGLALIKKVSVCLALIFTGILTSQLLSQDWQAAVEGILAPRESDRPWLRRSREFWWMYRDAGRAIKIMGPKGQNSLEQKMLRGLNVRERDKHWHELLF